MRRLKLKLYFKVEWRRLVYLENFCVRPLCLLLPKVKQPTSDHLFRFGGVPVFNGNDSRVSAAVKSELRVLFRNLCQDDTPMVRRYMFTCLYPMTTLTLFSPLIAS